MQTYKHSGGSSAAGILLMLLAGTVTAAILGVVYTYFIVYVPFIYLNFLATGIFGLVVGGVVGWAATAGKTRNVYVTGAAALLSALIGLYVAWIFDPMARQGLPLAFDPEYLVAYMRAFYEQGLWGLSEENTVKGVFLAGVWIAEALIIFGTAAWMANFQIAGQPFCENCNQWTKTQEGVGRLLVQEDQAPLANRLAQGDLTTLAQFTPAGSDDAAYLQLDLATCPNCSHSNFLTIKSVVHGVDKEGKATTETTDLVKNMILTERDSGLVVLAGQQSTPDGAAPTDGTSPDGGGQLDEPVA